MPASHVKNAGHPNRSPPPMNAPSRQSSMSKVGVNAAVSGRNTPHSASFVGSRPDSASGINRRHVASPDLVNDNQYAAFPTVFDDGVDDDEQDKGHGNKGGGYYGSSGRWTPTILTGLMRNSSSPIQTFTHANTSNKSSPVEEKMDGYQAGSLAQGRKTPAKYRPVVEEELEGPDVRISSTRADGQSQRNNSHPLSHAHKYSSASTASNSSHSIHMHSSPSFQSHNRHPSLHSSPHMSTHSRHSSMHIGLPHTSPKEHHSNSSPLIVPQARRGAINLRPACRKKKAALARRRRAATMAALASKSPQKPLGRQLMELLSIVISTLRCPKESARCFQVRLQITANSIDASFRDARTGQRDWRPSWLGAYIPLLIWLVVSLTSTITVLIWHTQVFRGKFYCSISSAVKYKTKPDLTVPLPLPSQLLTAFL
jgi:hypothetical protein